MNGVFLKEGGVCLNWRRGLNEILHSPETNTLFQKYHVFVVVVVVVDVVDVVVFAVEGGANHFSLSFERNGLASKDSRTERKTNREHKT